MDDSPERNRQRAAIWSVPEDWQRLYVITFSIQYLTVLGLVSWHEISAKGANSWPDTLISIGQIVSSLTLGIAANSVITTEFVRMISEWYRERRYWQGAADTQRKWEEWNQRREAAAATGEDFTEPPPSLRRRSNSSNGNGQKS